MSLTHTKYEKREARKKLFINILIILALIMVFLLSIDLIGAAFLNLSKTIAESFLLLTSNPFIGLFIGLLITTIIQSSSTSTSMIVAVVASGSLSLRSAIPMIMGANIGTTITSTLVSLAFITKKAQFRRALSAGASHDMFNILITIVLFPLEYYYGFLTNLTQYLADLIVPNLAQNTEQGFQYRLFNPSLVTNFIIDLISNSWVVLILAFVLLLGSIKLLSKEVYRLLKGEFRDRLQRHFETPSSSFLWGLLLTGAVQSSSITTSLIVPIVATSRINLQQAFPFIMGANIGTTLTAFLAALFKSNAAISIAIAHLTFNLIGVIIFLPFAFTRRLPLFLADELGRTTMNYRLIGFFYIIIAFFLLPFTLIYLNQHL